MALILRSVKGSKLTIPEMDGNLEFLYYNMFGDSIYITGSSYVNISSSNIILNGLEEDPGFTHVLTYENTSGKLYYYPSHGINVGTASIADTASFVTSSNVFGPYGSNSILSSSYALSASFVLSSSNAQTASFYNEIDPIFVNKSASLATTGSNRFNGNQYITGSLIQGENSLASGLYANARGQNTTASANYSCAEGSSTKALQEGAHAEGGFAEARGYYSHAEGRLTEARGDYSHAEGYGSIATGLYSHAGGVSTVASGSGQTVYGQYNARNNTSSLFIVGGGSGLGSAFQDAFSVEQEITGTGINKCHIVIPVNNSDPNNPKSGSMYYNSADNTLRIWIGSWKSSSFN